MKKIITIALALLMVISLVACGTAGNNQGGTNTPSNQQGNNASDSQGSNNGNNQGNNTAEGAKLNGKLNLINLDDRDPSVLRGVTIKGNCAGTAEGFNNKEKSLTDVRCIFELNEWVEFYPDTDKEYALRVWILKHRDDQEYYNTCKFSDLMPNFASFCDLHYPADEEKPDECTWGSFYLNKDECKPGYYDFVFTYEGKAIATLLTRFYAEDELTVKSDAELEALMHE
jgi:hypothetical protein